MEAQLGLIGGTMGLLTGFSILSAFEVIFFLLKLVLYSIGILLNKLFSGSSCHSSFLDMELPTRCVNATHGKIKKEKAVDKEIHI